VEIQIIGLEELDCAMQKTGKLVQGLAENGIVCFSIPKLSQPLSVY